MFGPIEGIMHNYIEVQKLYSVAVSTNNNESAEFYSSAIILLLNHISRYVSGENDDE